MQNLLKTIISRGDYLFCRICYCSNSSRYKAIYLTADSDNWYGYQIFYDKNI
ncbi:hypothetical protein SALWKB2_1977 [Snodgrassella alvi wkB2]|nr:hypothetical protein SALWKB2_1977 [Snodgrassella alvi wkB2]